METEIRAMRKELRELRDDVRTLLRTESERRGAGRAMKVLWGMSVAAISLATTWITLLLRTGGHS